MIPYYEHAGITIYHADCRDVLPTLGPVDLVLTDPPYGTGWVRGGGAVGEFVARHERPSWDVFRLDWIDLIQQARRYAVFGPVSRESELLSRFPGSVACRYNKSNPRPNGPTYEPIIVQPEPRRDMPWHLTAYNGDNPYHPTQKPIEVMRWLVALVSDDGDSILDPFMGSGTTLRAAKDLGRRAIGIEIEERYCEIAARRLSQEVMAL